MSDKQRSNRNAPGVGLALGIVIGSVIGVATDNIGLWIPIGVATGAGVGTSIGAGWFSQKKKQSDEKE